MIDRNNEVITLAHGEGGRLMRRLIRDLIQPILNPEEPPNHDDAATFVVTPSRGADETKNSRLAITTDSFVVSPIEFPGGDIGSLAVHGTINDLCVSGAVPQYLTLSLIIEEGFSISDLQRILNSVAAAARESGVKIVAGDTKVVPRGVVDRIFINTTGVGELADPVPAGPATLAVGDELIVTGPIGQHGIAVMSAREQLGLQPPPVSDCASLLPIATCLRGALGENLRSMRDATRGGVAAVLHEWAEACDHTLAIKEDSLPVSPAVRGACELLGLEPIHVANEGTMVVAVSAGHGADTLRALHETGTATNATRIGFVVERGVAPVIINRVLGNQHALDDPQGAPMPRIC